MSHDNISRIEVELAPGYYWRVKHTLRYQDVQQIGLSGFVTSRNLNSEDDRVIAAEGNVLLLDDVKLVNDIPHAAMVRAHPLENRFEGFGMLIDNFLAFFEPVDQQQAEKQREEELKRYNDDLQTQQNDLMKIASNPPTVASATNALPAPSPKDEDDAPTVSAMVAANANTQAIKTQVSNLKAAMEEHKALVDQKSKALQKNFERVTSFLHEKAAVAQARMKPTVRMIKQLGEGLETIGLYTGESLGIQQIRDGESAPPDAPLHLYQRLLYMDEESLVNVEYGGADFKHMEDFYKALNEDPALLTRLVPAERGLVVMQISRTRRKYSENSIENAYLNMQNEEHFLLVRDGERLHVIFTDLKHLDRLPRLFPTKDEFGRPFGGMDGDKITIKNIKYADAMEDARLIQLCYQRILVLLWGLRDNRDVLGPLGGEPAPCLLHQEVQQKLFRFVYDDEHALTDETHPPAHEWWKKNNASLAAGSRVLCHWNPMTNEENAPGVFSRYSMYDKHGPHRVAKFESRYGIEIVSREGDELVVRTPATRSYPERTFNARIRIARVGDSERRADGFLVLDNVTAKELDYYINSRRERRQYLEFIPSFAAAMRLLESEAPAEDALLDAVASQREEITRTPLTKEQRQTAFLALRRWRATHRWTLPEKGSDAFAACVDALYFAVFTQADAAQLMIGQAEQLCEQRGEPPLRLVLSGKKAKALYVAPAAPPAGISAEHNIWVKRLTLKSTKNGFVPAGESFVLLPERAPKEQVMHEWSGATEWVKRGKGNTTRRVGLIENDIAYAADLVKVLEDRIDRFDEEGTFEAWAHAIRTAKRNSSSHRMVGSSYCYIPIMYCALHLRGNDVRTGVLCAAVSEPPLLYALASNEDQRDYMLSAIYRGLYSYPKQAFNRLNTMHDPKNLHCSVELIDATTLKAAGSTHAKDLWGRYNGIRFLQPVEKLIKVAKDDVKKLVPFATFDTDRLLTKLKAQANVYTEKSDLLVPENMN